MHCTVLCSSCAVNQILKMGLTFNQKGEKATESRLWPKIYYAIMIGTIHKELNKWRQFSSSVLGCITKAAHVSLTASGLQLSKARNHWIHC